MSKILSTSLAGETNNKKADKARLTICWNNFYGRKLEITIKNKNIET